MKYKLSNVICGLIFIILGLGYAGRIFHLWDFNLFFNGWWTLFIIIPSFISLIRRGFNVGSLFGLGIGTMLFLVCNNMMSYDMIWRLAIPCLFVLIGLSFLGKNFFTPKPCIDETNGYSNLYSASFSGRKARVINEKFEGCTIDVSFGSVELDLTDAIFEEDTKIQCSCNFGDVKIILPTHVKVVDSNSPVFGSVNNKHRSTNDVLAPTVYINTTCLFGEVKIR